MERHVPHALVPKPRSVTSADSSSLLSYFQQLVPANLLEGLVSGHAGPFSSWIVIWLMVWQRSQGNASLAEAVSEAIFGPTSTLLPDSKRVRDRKISSNTSAYSQARSRLPIEVAIHVADTMFSTLVTDVQPSWKGRHAFLIDGSSLTLRHTPELVKQFPPATNQHGASHWPVVRFIVAHELSTGFSPQWRWGPMYGPNATSETDLAQLMLSDLPPSSILVCDRNFGIFALAYEAVRAGHDVTVRMTEKRFRAVTKGMKQTRPGEWTGTWSPSRWERRSHPDLPADAAVQGRFLEIRVVHEQKEVVLLLFTTDLTATPEELAELYRQRWSVESDIKDTKVVLNMKALSGQSVDMVEKEMVLGVVAYNLTLQIRRMAASRIQVRPRDLSFSRTHALVKAFARSVGQLDDEQRAQRFEQLLDAVARCRLPHRPGRSYPREVIVRGRGFPERKRPKLVNKKT